MLNATNARSGDASVNPRYRANLAGSVSRWALASALGAMVAATVPAIAVAQGADITLTAGDDVHVVTSGDLPNGMIDAGDGTDTLVANVEDLGNPLDISRLLNFEIFTMSGTGELVLSGDGSDQYWGVESGILTVGVGATVGDIFGCCGVAGTSVINDGTIVAGGSIDLFAASEGSVLNFGTVEDGYVAVDGDLARASNAGSINLVSYSGAAMSANGEGASLGNTGTITGVGERLIGIAGAGTGIVLVNEGSVTVQGEESTGADLTGDGWGFHNSGSIIGDAYGIRIVGANGTGNNAGTITAHSRSNAVAGMEVIGDNNFIGNTGRILAGLGDHTEDGPIGADPFDAFLPDGLAVEGDGNEVLNHGDIGAMGRGANGVSITGADNSLTNYGNLAAEGEDSIGVNVITTETIGAGGTTFPETVTSLDNYGYIAGGNVGVRYGSSATQSHTLTNHAEGLIQGAEVGILGGDGDETIHNYGNIIGETALSLGAGDDTVYFYGGSEYEGAIEGGDGYDEFYVAGDGSLTLNLADLSGFELHQLMGSALLTLTGQDAESDWFINGGQIIVAEGAVLHTISQPFTGAPAAAVGIENNGTVENLSVEGGGSVIVNNGAIINTHFGGYGISVYTESGDGVQVFNNGSILATGARGGGVGLAGGGHQLQNAGSIIVEDPDYGIGVLVDGDGNLVTNTGSILAANSAFDVEGDSNTIANFASGIIRGAYGDYSHQVAVQFDGMGNEFINAGLVSAGYDADGDAVGNNTNSIAVLLDGTANQVNNSGTIQGAGAGVQGVAITGESNIFSNSGTILVEGDGAIAVRLAAVSTIGGDGPAVAPMIASIENSGLIEAFGEDAMGIVAFSAAGQTNTMINHAGGTIDADGLAVLGGDGSEILVNGGTIIGGDFGLGTAIDLGAGDDALVLLAGSQIIGIADGGEGFDRIGLGAENADDVGIFYAENYINFEQISIDFGDWRFAGSGSFGRLTIGADSRLGGNGDLTGDLIVDGTLAPGNSIGQITVIGDVTLASGSTFAAEVAADGLSDQLAVDGRITLHGGQLQIQPVAAGVYSVRTEYTLMTATNGIVGAFGSVAVSGAFDAYTNNTGSAYELVLVRQVDFTADATTPNAASVGTSLNAELGETTGADMVFMMDGILGLSAAERTMVLRELSGDLHASQISLNGQSYGRFMDVVGSQIRSHPATSGVWLEASVRSGEIDASPGAHGLDTEDQGITAGYQYARANGSIGVAIGFSQQETTGGHVEANTDNYGATAYVVRQSGAYTFSAHLGWMSHDVDTARELDLAFIPGTISTGYRATTLGASARIARQSSGTMMGGAVFQPELALNFATTDTEDFSEAGDPVAALNVRPGQLESLTTNLGASLVWGQTQPDSRYSMRLHGAWVHEYLDETATLSGQFQGASSSFLTEGTTFDRDRFQAGVSVSARMGASMRVDFDYLGESSGSQTGHSLSARLVAPF